MIAIIWAEHVRFSADNPGQPTATALYPHAVTLFDSSLTRGLCQPPWHGSPRCDTAAKPDPVFPGVAVEIKSGCVLYSSVLYWNATRLMADMATATGDTGLATALLAEANKVQAAATKMLWNDQLGVFMASTGLERLNVDIWANAMAGAMGFSTADQDARMFAYFQANEDKIFYEVCNIG